MANSDGSDHNGFDGNPPSTLLPYQEWIEAAYRQVTINALKYAAQNGLPGNHSFYLTFLTSYPGVSIPSRLKAQYPDDITIVLQHQFWDLIIDDQNQKMSIGLSFGGIASTLIIPFGAMTAFSDQEAKLLLTFAALPPIVSQVKVFPTEAELENKENINEVEVKTNSEDTSEEGQVVSLDAFRKKHD